LTFEFKPFKKSGTKIRRKDIRILMLALMVNSVKKIIATYRRQQIQQKTSKTFSKDQDLG
jgi:hypothetical protein